MSRYLPRVLFVVAVLSVGCREKVEPTSQNVPGSVIHHAEPQKQTNTFVSTYGQLRAMMHENQIGPAVKLSNIAKPNLYALGALSELRGEVTVIGGDVWLGYPNKDDTMRVESMKTSDEQAALLVTANVDQWRDISVPEDIPWEKLDESVEKLAQSAGVNVEEAFPFLLDGNFSRAEWHVIDGTKLTPGPSSHKQHMDQAVKGNAALPKAKVLGFFSKNHQGIFTHHGENTHLHLVDEHQRQTGHVDFLAVKAGTLLKVPND